MILPRPPGTGRGILPRVVFLTVIIMVAVAFCADAATIAKKNSTNTLNSKKSWIGNQVPGLADIALWDANVTGANTTSLGGNLSWQGIQITNVGGLVTINAGNTLTLGSSGINMSTAAFGFNLNCNIVLGAAQTWSVNSGKTLAAAGVISGTGNLTKSGAGMLTLSGANTYTGNTTISGGTVSVSSASGLGSGTGTMTLNATGIFQATGTFSTSRAVALGGTGGSASGGTFDVTGSNVETRTGIISGTGSLTKTGTGTLTLNAANTYAGDTFINGGTLSIGDNLAVGPQPTLGSTLYAVHMASGTTLQGTVTSTGDNRQLQLSGGSATLDVPTAVSRQNNGLIYGSGSLVKSGAGTEIVTNANTYTGGTTINGGTLQVNNATGSGTGTGAVAVNSGATLSGLPTATGFSTPGTISGTVTVNSGGALLARSGGTFTFGGLTLNSLAISNFQLGTPTATSLITISGVNGLTLAGLSTINITNAGSLAAGTYRLFDYTGTGLASIANLQLGSTPGGGFTYSLSNNLTNTSIDLLVSTSNQQWANDASGNWNVTTNWTSGTVPNAVAAQANFFGVINQARTVTVNNAETVGTITFNNTNSYTLATDGVSGHGLTLSNSGDADIAVLLGSHTISAPVALTNNLDITASSGAALTISGAITENSAGRTVTSDGPGTVTLSGTGANTYTGLTTVSAGMLNLNKTAGVNAVATGGVQIGSGATVALLAANQIPDTATVTDSGTFSTGTSSETIGALNGTGSVIVGSGSTLTVGASNNLSSTFDGVISGAGTIAKAGAGTLTLNGANTFGGAGQTVAINGGSLQIPGDSSLGNAANSLTFNGGTLLLSAATASARNISLTGAGTIDTGNTAASLSGTINGAGGLTKAGSGTLTISGTNGYTGGTTINAGTVVVNSASSLGAASGNLTVNDGTFEVATGFTGTRNVVLGTANSAVQVDASQTYTAGGVVSGSGNLNKEGAGTLTLTRANTFTGETVVNGGTLIAAGTSGSSALGTTTAITVNSGGTLLLGASDQIKNTTALALAGGTFSKGNYSEGTAGTVGMGALVLGDDSTIDFGAGTVGVLTFASFSPDVNTLLVNNWTGVANTAGGVGTDRLIFASDQSANLPNFQFTGFASGAAEYALGGGLFEVVPVTEVPEPSTYAAAALAMLGVAYHQRRRIRSVLKRSTAG